MNLAGNVTVQGAMTPLGEVMMKEGMRMNNCDISWILPVNRMQDELGIEARWRGDGTAALMWPSGEAIELVREQGLAFLDYNKFGDIRKGIGRRSPEREAK